jgi:hypothetical protein
MAGIEFDRQMFAAASQTGRKPQPKIFGAIVLVVALGLAGLVSYKILTLMSDDHELKAVNAQAEQLQLQLADTQHQLEELEKHRKLAPKVETPAPVVSSPAAIKTPAPRPDYRVTAGSVLPPQQKPANQVPVTSANAAQGMNAEATAMKTELAANHEAWQATTDRLADVVGVVGQQQNEITETRDAVNQLLSQTRRQAVSFELRRGDSLTPVGPVSLQLKNVDSKAQRYSVCVYFQDRCIELKDRVLNEVVVFVVSKDSGPLELVATKILHDQIVGYLQVPVEQPQTH